MWVPVTKYVSKTGYLIHSYFLTCLFFSLSFILSFFLSILSLTVGTDDLNDRINVILTLLLTAVAFKFVIADAIPKVGYSTLIDDFVLYNMAFLFGQLFLCIVLHKLEHGGHDDDDDDEESPSHLMATHLSLFHLTDDELKLRMYSWICCIYFLFFFTDN